MTTAKFEDNFWGEGNRGFDVLLQNLKAQATASKELGDYIKERALVEDVYVKSLSKLHKTVCAVPEAHCGAFIPMWKLVKDTSEQLSTIHSQFFKMLNELAREITEYNISQREKMKNSMRGEIDNANDSLIAFNTLNGQLQRTKKQYIQGVEHVARAQEKLNKGLADPTINAKTKQHLESKVKQALSWMETMKTDHQTAVRRQCEQLMEFQGKMKEACGKFESLEEEHLAQMSTFMLKLARSQNSTLVNIEQHYAAFNSHLDDLSVEKLLLEFVQAKSTGTDKPTPYKFRPIDLGVPPISLSVSMEDIRSTSPTPKNTSRGEKSIKSRFKKKKQKIVANGPVEEHQKQPENSPEVDEEGYSIRPENAASISQFPDEPPSSKNESDTDSDFDDDEPESRIKNIKIKDTASHPQATVDELKASVMSLRLGAGSPGIKKATSTHSLNALPTPPANRKESSHSAQNQTADDSKSISSLLDLDDIIIGPPTQGAGGLPPPLMPSLFNIDPMATLTPLSLQPTSSSSSSINSSSSILTPTPAVSTAAPPTSSSSSNSLLLDPGMGNVSGPRPIPRPRNPSTLKANSQEQRDPFSAFEEAKDKPTELPALAVGGIIPPLPSKKRKSTGMIPSTSSQSLTSTTSATGVTKSSSGYSIVSITSEKSFDSVSSPFETNFGTGNIGGSVLSQDDRHLSTKSAQQTEGGGDIMTGSLSAGSSPKMSSKFPKDGSSKSEQPDTIKAILPPPQAGPRKGSGGGSSRRRSANPPPGTGDLLLGQASSPLATTKIAARSTSASPISFSSATNGLTSTSNTASPQHTANSSPTHAIPIAVAIQEMCNAIFKGNDMSKCVIKINGEVMLSFPANYVSQLASHDVLAFRVGNVDSVERLLHNQHLLKKEADGYTYKFDMPALVAHLKQVKEKQNSPYCNVQILKYEVKATNGDQLPLKLVSFWKCEPSMTNFRLDYIYQPSSLKQPKKPTMTNISVVVPVSGGVRKSLSKPEGNWVAEQNRMMWKLEDLKPEEGRGSLHAKFDVSSGPTVPAPAIVQFLCDGATMSGFTFELSNDAYRVSLTKNKCLSGKYTAEIVHHY